MSMLKQNITKKSEINKTMPLPKFDSNADREKYELDAIYKIIIYV